MLRIFRRSRLPIWYTEGFNPHPYYSFALALSLGYESSCEILDFNLNEEIPYSEVMDKLNAVMPEGMRITSVAEPKLKITAIAKAKYTFSLAADEAQKLYDDIRKLLAGESILIEKKTKKGIKIVDIKPDMEVTQLEYTAGSVNVSMRLPAGTQTNYNPSLFFEALKSAGTVLFEPRDICRTAILCEDSSVFA